MVDGEHACGTTLYSVVYLWVYRTELRAVQRRSESRRGIGLARHRRARRARGTRWSWGSRTAAPGRAAVACGLAPGDRPRAPASRCRPRCHPLSRSRSSSAHVLLAHWPLSRWLCRRSRRRRHQLAHRANWVTGVEHATGSPDPPRCVRQRCHLRAHKVQSLSRYYRIRTKYTGESASRSPRFIWDKQHSRSATKTNTLSQKSSSISRIGRPATAMRVRSMDQRGASRIRNRRAVVASSSCAGKGCSGARRYSTETTAARNSRAKWRQLAS